MRTKQIFCEKCFKTLTGYIPDHFEQHKLPSGETIADNAEKHNYWLFPNHTNHIGEPCKGDYNSRMLAEVG